MAAPTLIILILGVGVPLLLALALSFTEWGGSRTVAPEFLGFENYTDALTNDTRFTNAVKNTLILGGAALILELGLGTALGLAFAREIKGKSFARTMLLIPVLVSPTALGLVWRLMFEPNLGVINQIFRTVGLPEQTWLSDPTWALWAVVVVDVWQWAPFVALMVITSHASISGEIFEAVLVDGASPWQTTRLISLPLVAPTVIAVAMFRAVDTFRIFDTVFVMTGGGPGFSTETLNVYTFRSLFQYGNYGSANAFAVLLIFLTIMVLVAVRQLSKVTNKRYAQ